MHVALDARLGAEDHAFATEDVAVDATVEHDLGLPPTVDDAMLTDRERRGTPRLRAHCR